jgi:serine/threonine protein kinase
MNNDEDWINNYQKIKTIGNGTYGVVILMRHVDDENKLVAIKKLKLENETEGIPATTLREIAIISKIKHDNIIK